MSKRITKKMIEKVEKKGFRVDMAYAKIYQLEGNSYYFFSTLSFENIQEILTLY